MHCRGMEMCGIFGVVDYSGSKLNKWRVSELKEITKNLLDQSEIRGTDASGVCLFSGNKLSLFKDDVKGSMLKNFQPFEEVMNRINLTDKFGSLIGHTRQQTKGDPKFNINNHPIMANRTIGVHNGVIFNDDLLFAKYKDKIVREGEVDSEIIFRLIDMYIAEGKDLITATNEASKKLMGSYACAFINLDYSNYITLFKGSCYPTIYLYTYKTDEILVFASSDLILSNIMKKSDILEEDDITQRLEVGDRKGVRINTDNGKVYSFDIEAKAGNATPGGICSHCQNKQCDNCSYFGFQSY